MRKILAFAALASLMALSGLTGPVSAQDVQTLSADPPTVPAEGEHSFTVTGSGFTVASVFVLPCTYPGDPLTPASTQAEVVAALTSINSSTDCDLGRLTPAPIGADGTFSVDVTGDIVQNFAWAAGDAGMTESAVIPIFIVDPDSAVPVGGVEAGFGGMAESGGNSVAVPLAAGLVAVAVLGGVGLAFRRND